jgi:hypothetical protein
MSAFPQITHLALTVTVTSMGVACSVVSQLIEVDQGTVAHDRPLVSIRGSGVPADIAVLRTARPGSVPARR